MKTLNGKYIAKTQYDIWCFHDSKDYDSLREKVKDLFLNLGFQKNEVEKLSDYSKRAFVEYDIAKETKLQITQEELLRDLDKVHLNIKEALKLMGEKDEKISWYHTLIWREYINKTRTNSFSSNAKIVSYLFIVQARRFGISKAIEVFPTMIKGAYGAHYKKSEIAALEYLSKYYDKTLLIKGKFNYPDIFY